MIPFSPTESFNKHSFWIFIPGLIKMLNTWRLSIETPSSRLFGSLILFNQLWLHPALVSAAHISLSCLTKRSRAFCLVLRLFPDWSGAPFCFYCHNFLILDSFVHSCLLIPLQKASVLFEKKLSKEKPAYGSSQLLGFVCEFIDSKNSDLVSFHLYWFIQ